MRLLYLSILVIFSSTIWATIHTVGTGKTHATPNALYLAGGIATGDTIEIDAEDYIGADCLANWTADSLLIRGVGGMPHMIADGEYILGKGNWVLGGDDIIVENIEFSEAAVPSENGAGIRLDGTGMTARNCYFHNNENGILTSNPYAGDILIEYCEFAYNGFGDGFTHNLYIGHINKLTFRYNYSHHTNVGHNLKSRANESYIYYNRIMDEDTGNSSRLIDIPNGGFAIVMGNVLMQGENALNNNLIGYGLEGLEGTVGDELYVINNTMLNKRAASCVFVQLQAGLDTCHIANNIFAGTGTLLSGIASLESNYANTDITHFQFVDEPGYNYDIGATSPVIDSGTVQASVSGNSLTPNKHYQHPTAIETRYLIGSKIDVGAYEFGIYDVGLKTTPVKEFSIYPNPNTGSFQIMAADMNAEIHVYNRLGQVIPFTNDNGLVTLHQAKSGIYFISYTGPFGILTEKFIVE